MQTSKIAQAGLACLAAAAIAPTSALACGGLFCNNSTPVTQAQESVLFAVDDSGAAPTTHMHVRINYAGPPQEFGWLLPVPRGVATTLSSEGIFQGLEAAYRPAFNLEQHRLVECMELPLPPNEEDGSGGSSAGGGGNGGVEVLSREPVGPYDRAILDARSVEDLRTWLNENNFQIPADVDAKLRPYVDAGAVFVAIKLLPGEDAGAIVPLHLSFPGDAPTIPIVPTSVAADPDMGMAVHVLGASRAIPVNYAHVQINEAAIDWLSGGSNYVDVVAQASDEAGGQAFATDFSGPNDYGNSIVFSTLPVGALDEIRNAHTLGDLTGPSCELPLFDPDVARILRSFLTPPDFSGGVEPNYIGCFGAVANAPDEALDGAALAARFEAEIDTPRMEAAALFASHPWLTRFTTAMSPDEMTTDPSFSFNADLPAVSRVHTATLEIFQCDADGYYDYRNVRVVTGDGLVLPFADGASPKSIHRDRGMTVRKGDEPGAKVIETLPTSGDAVPVTDNSGAIAARNSGADGGTGGVPSTADAGTGGTGGTVSGADAGALETGDAGTGGTVPGADATGDSGCGCTAAGSGQGAPVGLASLMLLAAGRVVTRRRRTQR